MESPGKTGDSPRNIHDLDFKAIHSEIRPTDIRIHDRILARIRRRVDAAAGYVSIQVWKLSPLGVELVQSAESEEFKKGDPVDLEITSSCHPIKTTTGARSGSTRTPGFHRAISTQVKPVAIRSSAKETERTSL